jgi:hypothetical protein
VHSFFGLARSPLSYPPQRKGPRLLHELLLAAAVLAPDTLPVTPRVAKVESCLCVSTLPQVGQAGSLSNSLMRTIFSNGWPQSLQIYS